MLVQAILAAVIVSIASLVGIILLRVEEKVLMRLVSFAAGAFLGGFFLHILPKVSGLGDAGFAAILGFFVVFGLVEKLLHFHSHDTKRSIGWMNLLGDFFHNFLDGLAIAAAFKMDPTFGWIMTLIILAHEVPQELGDYAVLRISGFSHKKALLLNFLTALTAVVGVIVGWFISVDPRWLIAIVGGSFLYIAASDLIPLLREEIKEKRELITHFGFFLGGILLMVVVKSLR